MFSIQSIYTSSIKQIDIVREQFSEKKTVLRFARNNYFLEVGAGIFPLNTTLCICIRMKLRLYLLSSEKMQLGFTFTVMFNKSSTRIYFFKKKEA